ncbi:hypothetical protein [Burkholderia sp. GS2Y]|uniref:Uncharacterized protein n=1 Tax=Burkholderia theae TaxID=3143496 RepID=A0ABU9WCN9_9BURK
MTGNNTTAPLVWRRVDRFPERPCKHRAAMLGHVENVLIFLAALADEKSVDKLFVFADSEQHCCAVCQAGIGNE